MAGPVIEIVRLGSVDSTQRIARERARVGARSGTVIVAQEQTEGRGRDGRDWFSPAGAGVWLTWIHWTRRPVIERPAATSTAALAVAITLGRLGVPARIRWPNDVVATGGKIAGILADAEPDLLLIGVGVNGTQGALGFPEELRGVATSTAIECARAGREGPGIEAILGFLLDDLGALLDRFEREGPAEIIREVWEISVVRGRRVRIAIPGGAEVAGIAIGLGPAGELIVDRGEGPARTIPSGRLTAMEDA